MIFRESPGGSRPSPGGEKSNNMKNLKYNIISTINVKSNVNEFSFSTRYRVIYYIASGDYAYQQYVPDLDFWLSICVCSSLKELLSTPHVLFSLL